MSAPVPQSGEAGWPRIVCSQHCSSPHKLEHSTALLLTTDRTPDDIATGRRRKDTRKVPRIQVGPVRRKHSEPHLTWPVPDLLPPRCFRLAHSGLGFGFVPTSLAPEPIRQQKRTFASSDPASTWSLLRSRRLLIDLISTAASSTG